MGFRLTDVVKNLLIINVLMFIGTQLLGEPSADSFRQLKYFENGDLFDWGRSMLAVFFPTSEYFRPYQIVTHMFMHADMGHLFSNMLGLVFLGPFLENYLQPKRFFVFYFGTAFGAWLLYMGVAWYEMSFLGVPASQGNIPMLGASGAIFGLIAGAAMAVPNNVIQLLFLPFEFKIKHLAIVLFIYELYAGINGRDTGVAHFAHIGGAIFGALMIWYWRKNANWF